MTHFDHAIMALGLAVWGTYAIMSLWDHFDPDEDE